MIFDFASSHATWENRAMRRLGIVLLAIGVVAFFIAGSIFTMNAPPPQPFERIGYYCFWFWWVPLLTGVALIIISRNRASRPPDQH